MLAKYANEFELAELLASKHVILSYTEYMAIPAAFLDRVKSILSEISTPDE